MDKGLSPNEMYIQDIAKKLNDNDKQFKLSCLFSDGKTMFLILFAPVETLETPLHDIFSS
jgi:hypothetical protein